MPDSAALIAVLLVERPLCIRCLATKSELTLIDLDAVIANIEGALVLHRAVDRCRACGITDMTFSIDRPAI